ncbi:DUF6612 family protein [Paenibacillus sp. A14]|uniref:DUF6612 family protein n=1 Tax=Paenibacillus sp. A14 TaxID=3119820 RepID=UPI002FE263FA
MKKLTAVLLGAVLVLGMTACGKEKAAEGGANKAANGGANKAAETTTNTPAETKVPTVDELMAKSTEASEKLKSMSMEAKINQTIVMKQGDQSQEQKIDMTMKSDIVKEPMEMHQVINVSMGDQGSQNVEQYITKDSVYMNQGTGWMKAPAEQTQQLIDSLKQSASPEAQLQQFKSIAKEAKVIEEGGEYVLTADLSGDGVKDLAKNLMNQSGGQNAQTAAMLEQMNIKNIKISYAVNKDTFLPTKSNVTMAMDMSVEGQNVTLDMVMDSTISKYDEITKIEVPKEVLDSAK